MAFDQLPSNSFLSIGFHREEELWAAVERNRFICNGNPDLGRESFAPGQGVFQESGNATECADLTRQ
jgi:hypothetical protein